LAYLKDPVEVILTELIVDGVIDIILATRAIHTTTRLVLKGCVRSITTKASHVFSLL
jgi:hypothetical protein